MGGILLNCRSSLSEGVIFKICNQHCFFSFGEPVCVLIKSFYLILRYKIKISLDH